MQFLKAGEPAESNIFNRLDERKQALLASGMDVINLSIGTPDFQPDQHVMEAVSRATNAPAKDRADSAGLYTMFSRSSRFGQRSKYIIPSGPCSISSSRTASRYTAAPMPREISAP